MPKRTDIKKVMVIGSGPIVIGQACEFDYSGTQACKALKEEGYEVVLVNSNPATIMTDPQMADRTYIETLVIENIEKIIERENPDALLPNLGGQTGLNTSARLSKEGILDKYNVQLIGVKADTIERGEDRLTFKETMNRLNIEMPKSTITHSVEEAEKIANEDVETCKKIGQYGNELIKDKDKILTHCNAGALATVDYGTALAPIRTAHNSGKKIFVFVDETRPRCQGSRLTAWELLQENIPHAIIVDNAAGYYMQKKEIDICIVGADRVTGNGSVANKIGTYEKAVLAKENNIPFYVAAPLSTIDINLEFGNNVKIEERDEEEVTNMRGFSEDGLRKIKISPTGSHARNPAFDVTPARLVTGLITERGICGASAEDIKKLFPEKF